MNPTDSLRPPLGELFGDSARQAARLTVSDIAADSREVVPGGLFLAVPGRTGHGLDHIAEAVRRGAVAVAWEPAAARRAPRLPESVHSIRVPGLGRRLGSIADRYYAAPSAELTVVGITGTNGKTTCAWLLADALERLGEGCGYLGTLGVGRPGRVEPAALTTADAVGIHRSLARLRDADARWAAMEVSSHALDQQRIAGVRFQAAVFTNLSRDHLDYHGDMQRYGEAKARLFALPGLRACIVNADDEFGRRLLRSIGSEVAVAIGAAQQVSARYRLSAGQVRAHAGGLEFDVAGSWGSSRIVSALIGRFNVANLLSVLAVLLVWDVPLARATAVIAELPAAPGRMESFGGGGRPLVLVDYAHTPAALEHALTAAREHCGGRLLVVFGCGGDRDRGKRPLMGEIAARLADAVYLTNDNPRGEDPEQIAAEILQGFASHTGAAPVVELDRRAAIQGAVRAASRDDVVLIAGKGHETAQLIAGERLPFDDRSEARRALEAWQ